MHSANVLFCFVSAKLRKALATQWVGGIYGVNQTLAEQEFISISANSLLITLPLQIVSYLQQWGSGTKADFIKLLGDKLSDALDEKQKETKVRSLIRVLQKSETIERTSENKRTGAWRLAQKQ